MRQYRETGAWIDFTQGIDIRLVNDADIDDLNGMKIKRLHFAWDNPQDDLKDKFARFSERWRIKDPRRKTVYCLTNFENCSVEEHIERVLLRVDPLDDLGYEPYVMIYNKPGSDKILLALQRWCNNKIIYKATGKKFENYNQKTKKGEQ